MKWLLILAILVSYIHGFSQALQFKATKFVRARDQNKDLDPPVSKDLDNVPIELDWNSATLSIHSSELQVFHLDLKPFSGSTSDSTPTYKLHGVDSKGIKCIIWWQTFLSAKAPFVVAFWLEYPDRMDKYYANPLLPGR